MSATELSVSVRANYFHLLEQQFGLRLAKRQAGQLDALVLELLARSPYSLPDDLYRAFAAGRLPHLLEVLTTSLTVGETHFFRVPPQIDALQSTVLPDLIARHETDRRLRIWSAGCSTGEEPYTLAMLLCERLVVADWDIQLVATDLNRAALELARLAVYGEWSFRDSPGEVRPRYFTPTAERWRLNDQVRRMVTFAHLNLADGPFPFADERIDLILCRNVTIYFSEPATRSLYQRFAEAMDPAGWLLLGPSDPVPSPASGLEVVAFDGALVWRRRTVARLVSSAQRKHAAPVVVEPARRANTLAQTDALTRSRSTTQCSPSLDPLVHLHAGMARLDEGAPAAAIDCLRRAAFLDESSALVQFSLGTAYKYLADAPRSRSAFLRARRLLAGLADDLLLPGDNVAAGELRHVVDVQLADLDRPRT